MELPSIVPPPHGKSWPEAPADVAGMNWMWLEEAARFATENETPWPNDLRLHLESGYFEPPPFNEILGPIRPRGRGRRKAAPPSEDEAVRSAEAIAVAAPEPADTSSATVAEANVDPARQPEEAPRRPRKELPADEIVVSSTATESKPKKAGWWQRGFFGN